MTVCYLEIDDEITGAIARIRAVRDGEAVIVVPPGLAHRDQPDQLQAARQGGQRAAAEHRRGQRRPAVRALAIAAGMPAYDSVPAAEKALAKFREQDRKLAERLGREPRHGRCRGRRALAAMDDAEADEGAAGAVGPPSARAGPSSWHRADAPNGGDPIGAERRRAQASPDRPRAARAVP